MTTNQFYSWLRTRHSDMYGPGRLESTKKLLQKHDLLPKYNERMEVKDAALFITTAILAPTFRLSSNGSEFIYVLKRIIEAKQDNVYSLLKLAISDYSFLRNLDQLIIDLSTGNTAIRFRSGKKELVNTIGFKSEMHGLRSFAILEREHLLDIMVRIQQNEDEGKMIGRCQQSTPILLHN